MLAEVCLIRGPIEHRHVMSFPPGAEVGQVACYECWGTGWWGHGPTDDQCGPCITCKGTGRVWVGLL
jgi:hypothetical protein